MVVDKDVPRHRKLYDTLRKHIADGVYKEGDLLPSENELCNLHGVTRSTVRQSLANLANDGYIKKYQGKGSVVQMATREIGILSVSGTTSAVGMRKLRTILIVKPKIIPWDENFMFPLSEIEIESGCIYFERLRFLDDSPVFYDISYIANMNLPRFTSFQFENQSLFSVLWEKYGIEVKGGEQQIKAIHPTDSIRDYLQLKPGEPVLHLERKMEANRPGLYIYSSIYCNTAKYSIFGRF